MTTVAEYRAAIPGSASNSKPSEVGRALTPVRWTLLSALAIVPAVAFIILPSPNGALQDVARLERLAPQLERAPSLSAEARDAVSRIATRTGSLALNDPSQETRRKAAVERINSVLTANQAASASQSGSLRLQQD